MGISKATASSVAPAAKGDLVVGSGTNDAAVLTVGTNNHVLTADSSTATGLKWATPAASGMTVIASGTLSGASITISSISQTYKHLQLVLQRALPAGANEGPIIRFNSDTGTNYRNTTENNLQLVTWNSTSIRLGDTQSNASSQSLFVGDIYNYANTNTWKMINYYTIQNRSGSPTNFNILRGLGFWQAGSGNTAINTIEIFTDTSAGWTSGQYILYGVN
jgi:hypothetical protein